MFIINIMCTRGNFLKYLINDFDVHFQMLQPEITAQLALVTIIKSLKMAP